METWIKDKITPSDFEKIVKQLTNAYFNQEPTLYPEILTKTLNHKQITHDDTNKRIAKMQPLQVETGGETELSDFENLKVHLRHHYLINIANGNEECVIWDENRDKFRVYTSETWCDGRGDLSYDYNFHTCICECHWPYAGERCLQSNFFTGYSMKSIGQRNLPNFQYENGIDTQTPIFRNLPVLYFLLITSTILMIIFLITTIVYKNSNKIQKSHCHELNHQLDNTMDHLTDLSKKAVDSANSRSECPYLNKKRSKSDAFCLETVIEGNSRLNGIHQNKNRRASYMSSGNQNLMIRSHRGSICGRQPKINVLPVPDLTRNRLFSDPSTVVLPAQIKRDRALTSQFMRNPDR